MIPRCADRGATELAAIGAPRQRHLGRKPRGIEQTVTKVVQMLTDQLTQPVFTQGNSRYRKWVLNGRPFFATAINGQLVYPGGQAWPGMPKDDAHNGPGCSHCDPPPPPIQPHRLLAPPPPVPCIDCSFTNQPAHGPNDRLGPGGYGPAGSTTPSAAVPYTIEFSNEKTAQVPADNVIVTEQLSPNLNWSTFQLGTIGFGSYVVNVPPGLTSYSTQVDAVATLGVLVDIDASLNLSTGLLTVTFTSLDPDTLATPANPLVGFLPPDTDPPNGEGYINYTIQPKAGLTTGATINAQASIVFDTNAAIATPQIVNTIDASPPTSTVTALPATTTSTSFTVSWSGSDGAGPGINNYNVYVSDDGGAYTLWQSDTTATSATYTGQVGHDLSLLQRCHRQRRPRPADADSSASDDHGHQHADADTDTSPTPTPPPLVTVESLQVETIKVGKGRRRRKRPSWSSISAERSMPHPPTMPAPTRSPRSSKSRPRARARTESRRQPSWDRSCRWPRLFTTRRTTA